MYARWSSFAVGLWLLVAPLVLAYDTIGPILHHVALGLLVCIATLAALEWPTARFALGLPAAWLLYSSRVTGEAAAARVELGCGLLLLALAFVPSARLLPRVERTSGVDARI